LAAVTDGQNPCWVIAVYQILTRNDQSITIQYSVHDNPTYRCCGSGGVTEQVSDLERKYSFTMLKVRRHEDQKSTVFIDGFSATRLEDTSANTLRRYRKKASPTDAFMVDLF
jgi:hypothetical protein